MHSMIFHMICKSDFISKTNNEYSKLNVGNEVNAKYKVPMHPGKPGKLKNKFPGVEKSWKKEKK